ncbi:3 beta-hydroxysteroid dehydrogenase type 7 isoform 2-T5 [Pluvialis apricaria]
MIGSWQQPSLYSSTTKTTSEMDRAWVYLVTGGCGFIGEKIVELLSQQDYIKEVRVFDSVAREEVEIFTTGTENVLRACCVLNVPYVVYTSSIAAVGPNTLHEPMFRGNEDTKYSGEVELPYGKTKAMAEKLVFEANGKKLSNGGKLTTCIIRANTVYGEKATFLQELYLFAKAGNGVLNYLEPENTERNYTYVGNVAWMHVLAARNLQLKPDSLAGQVYYSYDDTPTRKGFLIRHQLLSSVDPSVRLGSHIPYWKMWLMIQLHRIIRVILYPFWKPRPFLNLPLLNTIVTTFSYETDKASRHFGYKPLFTWKESKHRTAQWLKAAAGNLERPQLHEKKN